MTQRQHDDLKRNVDRTVCFSILRRLSKLSLAEMKQEEENNRLAKRSLLLVTIFILIVFVVAVVEPAFLSNLFRAAYGMLH